eukprot:scaffold304073_cov30-Tisochrysis_lutea.AAC.3
MGTERAEIGGVRDSIGGAGRLKERDHAPIVGGDGLPERSRVERAVGDIGEDGLRHERPPIFVAQSSPRLVAYERRLRLLRALACVGVDWCSASADDLCANGTAAGRKLASAPRARHADTPEEVRGVRQTPRTVISARDDRGGDVVGTESGAPASDKQCGLLGGAVARAWGPQAALLDEM